MEENRINLERQAPSKAGSDQFTEEPSTGLDTQLEGIRPQTDLRKPPGGIRVLGVLAGLWFLIAIPSVTDTGTGFIVVFLLLAGMLLGWVWCHVVHCSFSSIQTRADHLWALSAPGAGLLAILLAVSAIGLQVRVALCRPFLERYVATVPAGTNASLHPSHFVGTFWVDRVEEDRGTVLLFTSKEGLMNSTGLAYIPPGGTMPAGRTWIRLERLSGNWYCFEERWS